jgi:hypothetical protein
MKKVCRRQGVSNRAGVLVCTAASGIIIAGEGGALGMSTKISTMANLFYEMSITRNMMWCGIFQKLLC